MRRPEILLALLFTAAVSPACSRSTPPPQRACTLIGCESGLTVVLDDAPAEPYRVEVSAPGETEPRVVECSSASPCGGRVFLRDFTPESATVRVVAGGDTVAREVRPTYETLQPNGPGCPPTCRQAEVRVTLPAAGS